MSVASWNAPAHGVFSFEEDRKKVSKVFREALWKKLQQLLRRRDLPSFRFPSEHPQGSWPSWPDSGHIEATGDQR